MFLNKVVSIVRGLKLPSLIEKLYIYYLILIVPLLIFPLEVNGKTIHQRKMREIGIISMAMILSTFLQRNIWLRYLLIWCVMNWWLNFFIPANSLNGLIDIFSLFLIYIGLKYCIDKKILKVDILLKILCFDAMFQMFWSMFQYFNIDYVFYPINAGGAPGTRVMDFIGWSGNPAIFASSLVLTAILFLHYFRFKKFPIILIPIFLCLLKIRNFTSFIALFSGLTFYFINNKKYNINKIIVYFTIIILILGVWIFLKTPNFDRFPIWKFTIQNIIHYRPIVGLGVNSFSNIQFIDKTQTPWDVVHNDYLQIILEIGITGFILFIGFLISKFKQFFQYPFENKQLAIASCLVVYLISMFPFFPMHLAQLSFKAIVLLVCLEGSYDTSCYVAKSA